MMLRQGTLILCVVSLVFVAGVASATTYTITDLGTLSRGTNSFALGVNNYGQAVGTAYDSGAKSRAVVYTSGSWLDIGTAFGNGGLGFTLKASYATGINDSGQVCGWAQKTLAQYGDTFIWQSGVGYTNIGTVPGVVSTNGPLNRSTDGGNTLTNYWLSGGITSTGQVVGGFYYASTGHSGAYLYSGGSTSEVYTLAAGGLPRLTPNALARPAWSLGITLNRAIPTLWAGGSIMMERSTTLLTGRIRFSLPATTSLDRIMAPTTRSFTRSARAVPLTSVSSAATHRAWRTA